MHIISYRKNWYLQRGWLATCTEDITYFCTHVARISLSPLFPLSSFVHARSAYLDCRRCSLAVRCSRCCLAGAATYSPGADGRSDVCQPTPSAPRPPPPAEWKTEESLSLTGVCACVCVRMCAHPHVHTRCPYRTYLYIRVAVGRNTRCNACNITVRARAPPSDNDIIIIIIIIIVIARFVVLNRRPDHVVVRKPHEREYLLLRVS